MIAPDEEKRVKNFCAVKKYICLQFPDHLLEYSASTVSRLALLCPDNEFYVMADTTFGSCCIDKVAGEHGNADGIIHFGPACLSKPSYSCPPVLWVFERSTVDIVSVVEAIQLKMKEGKLLLLTDTSAYHCLDQLKELIGTSQSLIYSTIRDFYDPKSCDSLNSLEEGSIINIQGRTFSIPNSCSLSDISLFYLGHDSLTFSNIIMNIDFARVISFDPSSSLVHEHTGEAGAMIRRRYIMVQKARDANCIGIVVGTLGVADYLKTIDSLKKLIIAKGKKPYLLAVGKPNPAKLGNFLEIDAFVLIACPENSLLDAREFMAPIVTPYELLLALDFNSLWDSSTYELDLEKLLPRMISQIELEHERCANAIDDESDEEPHFSLVTGGYAVNKRFISSAPTQSSNVWNEALVKRSEGTVSKVTTISAGAEYWKSRSFKGLEVELTEEEAAFSKLELGREGIAKGYSNED